MRTVGIPERTNQLVHTAHKQPFMDLRTTVGYSNDYRVTPFDRLQELRDV